MGSLNPRALLKSGLGLVSTDMLTMGLNICRTLVLARLLTTEDFGVCLLLASAVASVQLLTDFGVDKLIVQDRTTNPNELQATLAALMLVRGAIMALLLVALSFPFAWFFKVPEASLAFASLGVVALLESLFHLDPRRFEREKRFAASNSINVTVGIVSFLSGLGAALLTGSYWAFPISLITGAVAGLIVSHLAADTPYRIQLHRAHLARVFAFGWPLMANGVIVLLMAHADRFIVARALGVSELGVYGICVAIASIPALITLRLVGNIGLPLLAEAQGEVVLGRLRLLGIGVLVLAALVAIPLIFLGETAIALLFGSRYAPPPLLIAMITISQTAIMLRTWPIVCAFALGSTREILRGNVVRIIGFALAFVVAWSGGSIILIAGALAVGEILALSFSCWRLRVHLGPAFKDLLPLLLALLGVLAVAILYVHYGDDRRLLSLVAGTLVLIATFIVVSMLGSPFMRFTAKRALVRIREW